MKKIVVVFALTAFYHLAAPASNELAEARKEYARFKTALTKAQELQNRGQAEAAEEQQRSAYEALEKAHQLFEKAGVSQSNDFDALMEYADALSWTGDSDLAREILEKAVKLKPDSQKAWLSLGKALVDLGPTYLTDAQKAFLKALDLSKTQDEEAETRATLVLFYWNAGLYAAAKEQSSLLKEKKPDNIPNIIIQAGLATREGRFKDAEAELNSVTQLSPQQGVLLNKVLAQALDDFDLSRGFIPDEAASHAAYAKLLIRANRVEESLLPIERAVKLAPDEYTYWNTLASVCRFTNDIDRAREAYARSLELYPDQPRIRDAMESLGKDNGQSPSPLP
ncbi:MAG TPA: tetratricopeptide repeat protein [Candidatus Hydrogenedentes bacterium]|nr:tetratricopeptide repeat protein [Candidatus Hydrogenedentota bacterium]HOL75747.1 tetratricopeptide repeat protein [Candidatus Hydrogenedentota bacterium]HPO84260.1 tetratricopeptide repeat protein [Candidatus Hydrogenedentota bacterium]